MVIRRDLQWNSDGQLKLSWATQTLTWLIKNTFKNLNVITAHKQSLPRLCFYRCLSVCPWGGMHGREGACMAGRGHAWQGVCMAGRGHAWQGPCMVGGDVHGRGHAWQGGMHGRGVCMTGGMCCRGHAWHACPLGRYYKIHSMSGWYASYWNAFLLIWQVSLLLPSSKFGAR